MILSYSKMNFMIGYKESVIDRKVFASIGSSLGAYITTMLGA